MNKRRAGIGLIILAYIAFISLGMPDGLMGVAWPSVRKDFNVPLDALGLLFITSMIGYNTSAFFSGTLLRRLGVGKLLAISCALTGATLIGNTLAPGWWVFVALGITGGLGAGAIDAGLNTFVASNYGEGLMQWLHACYGLGVTLGPLIMTTAINVFERWRLGYTVVGIAQLTLAAVFALTIPAWKQTKAPEEKKRILDYRTPLSDTLKQPGAWFSLILFFVYVGIEVTVGAWVYTLLTESRNVAPQVAGLWAGSYWGNFTVGRVVAGVVAHKIRVRPLLIGCMAAALTGALLLWWNPATWVSLGSVALIGFAVAPIFPGMVSTTSDRVSQAHTANTIGMQITATGLAVAIVPGLAGFLARRISLEIIPVYLVVLILILLFLFVVSHRKEAPAAVTA